MKKGFTLIELMIVVAILGIIVLPLTHVMRIFHDTWWQSRAKLTTQEDAREAAYWIIEGFKGARRTTLGSIVFNGGFELGSGHDTAYLWDFEYSDGAGRESSSVVEATSTVRSGFYSMGVTGPAEERFSWDPIRSEEFTSPAEGDYYLSASFRVDNATVTMAIMEGGTVKSGSEVTVSSFPVSAPRWISTGTVVSLAQASYRVAFEYDVAEMSSYDGILNASFYVDDVSLTPVSWEMVDGDGNINDEKEIFYYTTQVGRGGRPEGPLHALEVEERALADGGTVNRILRKQFDDSLWQGGVIYSDIYELVAGKIQLKEDNWRVLGLETMADNVSYLKLDYHPDSLQRRQKDSPLNVTVTFTGAVPTTDDMEFDVNTQVYPLTR